MLSSKTSKMSLFAAVSIAAASLSQLSSFLIRAHFEIGQTRVLTPFLWLTYVQNHGGIFGALQGRGWYFAAMTLAILAGLVVYLLRARSLHWFHYVCFGLIAGGGLSNVLDRLLYGAVIDFIDVRKIPHWKYIFNTADTFIHLGIWPMLLLSLKETFQTSAAPENTPSGDETSS